MMPVKISAAYTPLQKALHWAVVGLLLLQFFVFDAMGRPFNESVKAHVPVYSTTVYFHILIGATIFALAAWRLGLRLQHGAPAAPEAEPEIFRTASKLAHLGFYVLLLGLPIGGMGAWFLQSGTLGELHEIGTNLLLVLAIVHVGAVLVHQFVWKTGLIGRMT